MKTDTSDNFYIHILSSIMEQPDNNKIRISLLNNSITYKININQIKDCFPEDIKFIYHQYKPGIMQSAYEPFLSIIKDVYYDFFADYLAIDDFLSECNVFPVLKCLFSAYIETGICTRDEAYVLVGEINEYEEKRCIQSIADMLCYISQKHKLCIILNELHFACCSAIKLLLTLLNSYTTTGQLIIIGIFNSNYSINEYMLTQWSALINDCQTRELIFEATEFTKEYTEITNIYINNYIFNPDNFDADFLKIGGMIFSHATEQAMYYLNIINDSLSLNSSSLSDEQKINVYFASAYCNITTHNYKESLVALDNIQELLPEYNIESDEQKNNTDLLHLYYKYFYLNSMLKISQRDVISSEPYSIKCQTIAAILNNDAYIFQAAILTDFIDLYTYDSIPLQKDVSYCRNMVNMALEYGYVNAAITYLSLGYELDKKSLMQINTGSSFTYFETAVKLAISIDNIHLLKHMHDYKNMYAYQFECYNAAQRVTQICNFHIKKYTDKFLESGYNYTLREEYSHSFLINNQNIIAHYNKYLENKSVNKYIQDVTLNRYYLSEICMVLWDIAKDSIHNKCYSVGEQYISTMLTIMNNLHHPRLFNATFGLLYSYNAYCCIKQGLLYKSYSYINKATTFYSNKLNNDNYKDMLDYSHIFFYFLAQGSIATYEENYEKAQDNFNRCFDIFNDIPSSFLLDYDKICIEQSILYAKMGATQNAFDILQTCIKYYQENGFNHKVMQLEALANNQYYSDYYEDYKLKGIYIEELIRASVEEKKELQMQEEDKNSFFLSLWRRNLSDNSNDINQLIKGAISNIKNNFDMNYVLYISIENDTPNIIYEYNSNQNIESNIKQITDEQLQVIYEYIKNNHEPVYYTRLEKEFYSLSTVLDLYDMNYIDVASFVPISYNKKITRIFVMFHYIIDILSLTVDKQLQDKRLDTLTFALSYLLDTELNYNIKRKHNIYKQQLTDISSIVNTYVANHTDSVSDEIANELINPIINASKDL